MTLKAVIPIFIIVPLLIACVGLVIFCAIKPEYRRVKNFRRISMLVLVLFILMRPAFYTSTSVESSLTNLDIYFVADMTGSMVAKDCGDNDVRRYELAIEDMITIAKRFGGSSYSIIAEDFSVYTALPLTSNFSAFETAARALIPKNSRISSDSDTNTLFDYTNNHIKKNRQRHSDHQVLLFYFGDGEDRVNNKISIPNEIGNTIITGGVFGYGTEAGTEIEEIYSNGTISTSYVYDESNHRVVSSMNEGNIRAIAEALGVKYYLRSNGNLDGSALSDVAVKATEFRTNDETAYEDVYWIFALILLGVMLWEFSYLLNKLLLERKAVK